MSTKEITRIALLSCIQFIVFHFFSQILYLEMITLITCLFALVFPRKEACFASIVFTICNMLVQGVTIWTLGYLIIYPCYSLLFSSLRKILKRYPYLLYTMIGICSFLCGQLLDLQFILFDARVTMIYVLMGLKTSLIQGSIAFISAMFLFEPLYKQLMKLERKYS